MTRDERAAWRALERETFADLHYWRSVQRSANTIIRDAEDAHALHLAREESRRAEIKTEYVMRRLSEIQEELAL